MIKNEFSRYYNCNNRRGSLSFLQSSRFLAHGMMNKRQKGKASFEKRQEANSSAQRIKDGPFLLEFLVKWFLYYRNGIKPIAIAMPNVDLENGTLDCDLYKR